MELRFLILYFLSLSFASAQTSPHEELILQQVQETQGNPDLLDFILQEWEYRKSHKIRLNFCQAEELEALGILDIFQVHNLLQYRRRYGLIFGPRELVLNLSKARNMPVIPWKAGLFMIFNPRPEFNCVLICRRTPENFGGPGPALITSRDLFAIRLREKSAKSFWAIIT